MPGSLILAAPPGPTRRLLETFFADRGARVISLAREKLAAEQQLVLEDEIVSLDGEAILRDATAALVLDSGYMWPLPAIDPTPEQWAEHRGHFDDYLRDERESASFWYSLMEIIGDRVRVCVNPQTAFENEALKPFAFELLREAGVPLPPLLTTNDPDAVSAFREDHPGELLASELWPGAPARWLGEQPPARWGLERSPLHFQATRTRDTTVVMAVGGQAVACLPGPVDERTRAVLPVIQRALQMPWATLVFREGAEGAVLSDFSPSPDPGTLAAADAGRVLEALARLIELQGGSPSSPSD